MVIAHLGSGASVVAVKDGRSVDTSMGLTPTGGIVMATRSGDLDPGILLYLLRKHAKTPDELENLLNRKSGLLGISGSGDMRDLEARAKAGDRHAEMAIQIFCRSIAKTVASYAAVLGGIDLLVFTGGIGEHSARVRREVCRALQFMRLVLDEAANASYAETISCRDGLVQVRVLSSQEDKQIARHCRRLMQETQSNAAN
jgi:acetate kinase